MNYADPDSDAVSAAVNAAKAAVSINSTNDVILGNPEAGFAPYPAIQMYSLCHVTLVCVMPLDWAWD
jgi:hypothetical protein